MQSNTINTQINSNKKGACMDMIDDSTTTTISTNSTTVPSFERQQQQEHGLDEMELLLDETQQRILDINLQDSAAPQERRQQLYKTEICRNWEERRTCRYGNKCQYAHGDQDLRYVRRHPRYKTIHCRSFQFTGACPYGKRCTFLHVQTLPSDRISRGRQHYASPLDQSTPAIASPSNLFASASSTIRSKTTGDTMIPPYSPPMESAKSSPPSPLPQRHLPKYGTASLRYYPHHDQGNLAHLFTDAGGFSCAFGLSPPLPSPSNIPSTSYFSSSFSPSSSTATTSSLSSTTSSTSLKADRELHFFY